MYSTAYLARNAPNWFKWQSLAALQSTRHEPTRTIRHRPDLDLRTAEPLPAKEMKPLSPDQLRQNAAAMLAFADGKPIERAGFDGIWRPAPDPTWAFDAFCYRPKPEPVTRPWSKPEDVPLNCWLKTPGGNASFVIHVADKGVAVIAAPNGFMTMPWEELSTYQHSTDRRTWLPCSTQEP